METRTEPRIPSPESRPSRIGLIGHLLSFEPTYRQAGVSRYIEALVRELPNVGPDEEYVVFTGGDRPPAARRFDPGIEESARDLGASPWQAAWRVLLPVRTARPRQHR